MHQLSIDETTFIKSIYRQAMQFFITQHILPIISMIVCIILCILPIEIIEPLHTSVVVLIVVPLSFYIVISLNLYKFKPPPLLFEHTWIKSLETKKHTVYTAGGFRLFLPTDKSAEITLVEVKKANNIYSLTDALYNRTFAKAIPMHEVNTFLRSALILL